MSETTRRPGYYWVTLMGAEVIARWSSHGWWELHGTDTTFNDDEFESIDDEPIMFHVKHAR